MAPSLTVRLDKEVQVALDHLVASGLSKTEAVRRALLNEARRLEDEQLRAEAESLNSDPEDRAEMQRVMADMDAIRAW